MVLQHRKTTACKDTAAHASGSSKLLLAVHHLLATAALLHCSQQPAIHSSVALCCVQQGPTAARAYGRTADAYGELLLLEPPAIPAA
jgi:hypothetical protein